VVNKSRRGLIKPNQSDESFTISLKQRRRRRKVVSEVEDCLTRMAVSTCPKFFPSFECRSEPDFSGAPKVGGDGRQSRSRFSGRLKSTRGTVSFQGGLSSLIFRFPPNFVRQLSTKARRNCSNIGVAQIVAASWSNNSASVPAAAASAASAAATAATQPILPSVGDDVALVDKKVDLDVNVGVDFELEGLTNSKRSAFSSDGSLAIHAGNETLITFSIFCLFVDYCLILVFSFAFWWGCVGERSGRGIVTDAITTPVVNTTAYFFDNTAHLIDFKVSKLRFLFVQFQYCQHHLFVKTF
jgi:cystathionine gamma-synthase